MAEFIESSDIVRSNIKKAQRATEILIAGSTDVEKVILFGSTAKNTATLKSDIDLAVSISGSLKRRVAYTKAIVEELEQQGFRVDLEFNKDKFTGPLSGALNLGIFGRESDFPEDAITQGIVLFRKQ